MYTKDGIPLQVIGNKVYSKSGKFVGDIQNDKVVGPKGYVGTIVNDRLIYRSTDSIVASSISSAEANRVGVATANAVGVAEWGDEPDIPD